MTVAQDAGFPVAELEGCETALVVFAAAFGGVQDAAFIRDSGLRGCCLDCDAEALERMRDDYPGDWKFYVEDAFAFARPKEFPRWKWDVVTLDPWHGNLMDETIDRLADFCQLARKAVIAGTDSRPIRPPEGWVVKSRTFRSSYDGGIYWTTLVPA